MKTFKLFAIAAAALMLSSCNNDENGEMTGFVAFSNPSLQFDNHGYWKNIYSPTGNTPITFGEFEFSHYGEDGEYPYYYGFAPSMSTSTTQYNTTSQWLEHQWNSVCGGGIYGSMPYLVGSWMEYIDDMDESMPSCYIKRTDNATFKPVGIFVTNTSWAAFTMKMGSDMYPTPFNKDDKFELEIIGSRLGRRTSTVTVTLATDGKILETWVPVDLTKLGEVDMIYFRMNSTQFNEYGITIPPTTFCLDGFFIEE